MTQMTPDEIVNYRFSTAFRGYDTAEVRSFLDRVGKAFTELQGRVGDATRAVAESTTAPDEESAPPVPDVAAAVPAEESHSFSVRVIGAPQPVVDADVDDEPVEPSESEAAVAASRAEVERLLAAAQAEGRSIVARANEEAARIILRARAESRGRPTGDGTAVVEAALQDAPSDPALAREQARMMISEAKAVRERILTDLAKRRKTAHVQLEQLRVAREKLLESLREVRRVVDDASRDLSTAEVEARIAAENAGRRVNAEPLPTVAELDAELTGAGHLRAPGAPVDVDEEMAAIDATGEAVAEQRRAARKGTTSVSAAEGSEGAERSAPKKARKAAPRAAGGSVDDLFARLRAEREQAAAEAREVLGDADAAGAERGDADAGGSAAKKAKSRPRKATETAGDVATGDRADEALDPEAFPTDGEPTGVSARHDFVVGPLQTNLTRALKRSLQDDQSSAMASLRTARGRVEIGQLLGAEEEHLARIAAVVEPFLEDARRAGTDASGDAEADEEAAERVRELAWDLGGEISRAIRADLAAAMGDAPSAEADASRLSDAVGGSYRSWTTERIGAVVEARLRAAFEAGHRV